MSQVPGHSRPPRRRREPDPRTAPAGLVDRVDDPFDFEGGGEVGMDRGVSGDTGEQVPDFDDLLVVEPEPVTRGGHELAVGRVAEPVRTVLKPASAAGPPA